VPFERRNYRCTAPLTGKRCWVEKKTHPQRLVLAFDTRLLHRLPPLCFPVSTSLNLCITTLISREKSKNIVEVQWHSPITGPRYIGTHFSRRPTSPLPSRLLVGRQVRTLLLHPPGGMNFHKRSIRSSELLDPSLLVEFPTLFGRIIVRGQWRELRFLHSVRSHEDAHVARRVLLAVSIDDGGGGGVPPSPSTRPQQKYHRFCSSAQLCHSTKTCSA